MKESIKSANITYQNKNKQETTKVSFRTHVGVKSHSTEEFSNLRANSRVLLYSSYSTDIRNEYYKDKTAETPMQIAYEQTKAWIDLDLSERKAHGNWSLLHTQNDCIFNYTLYDLYVISAKLLNYDNLPPRIRNLRDSWKCYNKLQAKWK